MNKINIRSVLLPLAVIPVGGLVLLAISYLGYFAAYMLVESVFFSNDPTSVPAEAIRIFFALVLLVLYLALLRTKASELSKATVIVGPLTMIIIAAVLGLYLKPALALAAAVAIACCCIFLLYRYKKPWMYYYAAAISFVVAITYAWPRA